MKNFSHITLTIVIPLLFLIQPAVGQQQNKIQADNVQKTILLEEADAVLADVDNSVTVKSILGKKDGTELRRGDVIFMAQGLPVSSVSDLITLYEKTGKKKEFKMAVNRNGDKFLTSIKVDPSAETGREMFTGTMKFPTSNSSSSSMDLIPELLVYGVMAAAGDNGIVIKQAMPNLDSGLKEQDIKEGDKIVSVDGEAVNSHKEFKQVWDTIKEGEKVELKISKDGQIVPVSLSKKNVESNVVFKKKGN